MLIDSLGLQISTVASKATFSTSGQILDPYRKNLFAKIVQDLVCTEDWVNKSRKPIVDNIDEVLKDDKVVKELENVINNRVWVLPDDEKRKLFKLAHESARKDVERVFGALKQKWHIIKHLA
uniref:HAT C-terminal dimerisation domain-containing protein n=1 Tax=Lactuca sativa TaxID=4236 RepID=A0A9R1V0W3_LACSA|nr:hypothetical protein LSAT_V11C700350090 [Lactuca sativa]